MDCCGIAYVIAPGDTLSEIAQRFLGSAREWRRLVAFNNDDAVLALGGARIINPDYIRSGDTIRIPLPENTPAAKKVASAQPRQAGAKDAVIPSLMRTPRSDIYAYLNVHWHLLDDVPLVLVVATVMNNVPKAASIGADATERYVRAWLVSIDRRIADGSFHIDIPKISAPMDIAVGDLRIKWRPQKNPPTTSIITPPAPDGKLSVAAPFGTLSLTHHKLEKLKSLNLKVPVSPAVTLSTTLTPWSSIGFSGAWKTKGDMPDLDIGATFESADFSRDWSASYKFGIKNIKLPKNMTLDVGTSGPFDSFQSQSFQLKLKLILK